VCVFVCVCMFEYTPMSFNVYMYVRRYVYDTA